MYVFSLSSSSLHRFVASASTSSCASAHWWLRLPAESASSFGLLLLTLWISYGLINTENGASSFTGSG